MAALRTAIQTGREHCLLHPPLDHDDDAFVESARRYAFERGQDPAAVITAVFYHRGRPGVAGWPSEFDLLAVLGAAAVSPATRDMVLASATLRVYRNRPEDRTGRCPWLAAVLYGASSLLPGHDKEAFRASALRHVAAARARDLLGTARSEQLPVSSLVIVAEAHHDDITTVFGQPRIPSSTARVQRALEGARRIRTS
jgi:hypothetical protein